MKKETIKVILANDKDIDVEVHELLAIEFDELMKIEDKSKSTKSLIMMSCNMSEENYKLLLLRDRTRINNIVNKINGWESADKDFQEQETVEKLT